MEFKHEKKVTSKDASYEISEPDKKHSAVKKLKLDENQIKKRRVDEGIPY